MKTMGISEFKATCIAALKQVQISGEPLIVTHRGRAIVRVEPIPKPGNRLGALRHQGRINADLVALDFTQEWDMEQD